VHALPETARHHLYRVTSTQTTLSTLICHYPENMGIRRYRS
jgi:hypothetical protein